MSLICSLTSAFHRRASALNTRRPLTVAYWLFTPGGKGKLMRNPPVMLRL